MGLFSRIKTIFKKKEEKVEQVKEERKVKPTEKPVSTIENETEPVSINETETKKISINETETIKKKLVNIESLLNEELEKKPLFAELKALYVLLEKHDRKIANLITELAIARHITPKETRKEILAVINQAKEQGKNIKDTVEEIVSKGLCSRATAYRVIKSISTIEIEIEPISTKENETSD